MIFQNSEKIQIHCEKLKNWFFHDFVNKNKVVNGNRTHNIGLEPISKKIFEILSWIFSTGQFGGIESL